MPEQVTTRAKRLLILAIVTPWLFLGVYYGTPLLNSQTQHLRAVEEHIKKITPQWDQFRKEHAGFDNVQLHSYTGGNGMLGAFGYVPSEAHVQRLRAFIDGTTPPRPIYVAGIQVIDWEEVTNVINAHKQGEPDGAASRSQPVASGTNRTSAAAGSGR